MGIYSLKYMMKHLKWMTESWKIGIKVYIYKSGIKTSLINYRPSTLLNDIYEIWATIIANRLTPIMNLLANEMHHAYRSVISNVGVIYNLKRKDVKKITNVRFSSTCQNPSIE